MKLLLDTHILLCATLSPNRLSHAARILIQDARNEVVFSSADIWEVAIKHALGRPGFAVEPVSLRRDLLAERWIELPIDGEHGTVAGALPPIHKDPFDRILIAQAIVDGCLLLTADTKVAAYPGPITLV